jgi:hypothetical protein
MEYTYRDKKVVNVFVVRFRALLQSVTSPCKLDQQTHGY